MIKNLSALLDASGRRQYTALALISVASSLFQTAGVASISLFFTVLLGGSLPHWLQPYFVGDRSMLKLGCLVFIATLSGTITSALATYWGIRVSWAQYPKLASRLLGQFLYNDYQWHIRQTPVTLAKTVITETQGITITLQHCVLLLVRGMEVAFIAALLLWVRPLVALTAFSSFALIYSLLFLLNRSHINRLGQQVVDANTERHRSTNEALGGIKAVKVSGCENFFLERFRTAAQQMASANSKIEYFSAMPKSFIETIIFGGLVGFVVISNHRNWDTSESIPLLALYGAAAIRLLPAIQQLYISVVTLTASKASVERVAAGLQAQPTVDSYDVNCCNDALIELKQVSYTYPEARSPAIVNLSLRIDAGEKIGIVGLTGAGKTTLVDILLGLLPPTSGFLCRAQRRGQFVGYVPQQIHFIDDTFAANIALGQSPAHWNMDKIQSAARRAQLHDFIASLPRGYETPIGEQANRLSGGQRQRVGIARALYTNPALLVLDEASNALDADTERSVIRSLLDEELTLVAVSHRVSSLKNCSRILLIQHGKLSDSGSYDELMARSELFRRISDTDETTEAEESISTY